MIEIVRRNDPWSLISILSRCWQGADAQQAWLIGRIILRCKLLRVQINQRDSVGNWKKLGFRAGNRAVSTIGGWYRVNGRTVISRPIHRAWIRWKPLLSVQPVEFCLAVSVFWASICLSQRGQRHCWPKALDSKFETNLVILDTNIGPPNR